MSSINDNDHFFCFCCACVVIILSFPLLAWPSLQPSPPWWTTMSATTTWGQWSPSQCTHHPRSPRPGIRQSPATCSGRKTSPGRSHPGSSLKTFLFQTFRSYLLYVGGCQIKAGFPVIAVSEKKHCCRAKLHVIKFLSLRIRYQLRYVFARVPLCSLPPALCCCFKGVVTVRFSLNPHTPTAVLNRPYEVRHGEKHRCVYSIQLIRAVVAHTVLSPDRVWWLCADQILCREAPCHFLYLL